MTTEKPQLSALFTWRSAIAQSDLKPTTRLVALTLSLYMSERGDSAFPSQRRLARETGLDQQTVKRHLKVLRDRGYLRAVSNATKGKPVRYVATADPLGGTEDTGVGGAQNTGVGGTEDTAEYDSGGRPVEDASTALPAHPAENGRSRTRGTDHDRAALKHLVDLIEDKDEKTYAVYGSTFLGVLDASDFHQVADKLVDEWRAVGVGAKDRREPIKSEAAFVHQALTSLVNGYDERAAHNSTTAGATP